MIFTHKLDERKRKSLQLLKPFPKDILAMFKIGFNSVPLIYSEKLAPTLDSKVVIEMPLKTKITEMKVLQCFL